MTCEVWIIEGTIFFFHLKPASNRHLLPLDAWGFTQNSRNRHLNAWWSKGQRRQGVVMNLGVALTHGQLIGE